MVKEKVLPGARKKEVILAKIKNLLEAQPEISFAYAHGSFLEQETFGDIDLAIYLSPVPAGSGTYYELALESALEELIHYPVDLRILNEAPLSFKYSVLRNGTRILEKDEDLRVAFQEQTPSSITILPPAPEALLEGGPGSVKYDHLRVEKRS
ncbi:MAG: nucleotidyltransferase domain-containing protein [Firmicutes bacterium]|nr:nucleotidyltransferase domain-containing protein [Bacillota bacterium]